MIDLSKLPAGDADDTAKALGALVFALGITFPPALALQLADTLRACARIGPERGHTSAGTLIAALADAMVAAANERTPPH